MRMLFEEHSWAWNDNPFVGTRQLDGLKIVVMLLSNWDSKDRRDVSRGSNTAIFEYRISRFASEARYLITDWGGAMGKWGTTVVSRDRWDAGRLRGADARLRRRASMTMWSSSDTRGSAREIGRGDSRRARAVVLPQGAPDYRTGAADGVARQRRDRGGSRAVRPGADHENRGARASPIKPA